MRAEAAIATGADWREALESALGQMSLAREGEGCDLAMLFASYHYAPAFAELASAVQEMTGARVVFGCSGGGIIGPQREIEHEAALALSLFSLPGATLRTVHLGQDDLDEPAIWLRDEQLEPARVNAWLCLSDPFTLDSERLLDLFSQGYEGKPLIGGLSSGDPRRQQTHLFLNGEVFDEGAVALALGGPYEVRTVVSQGCAPIGEPWTITAAQGNIVETIGMRPAVDVLMDTFNALPQEMQERASRNLLIGLAMDEYKDELVRGDFLIRNLMGIDRDSGVIAVNALPRTGQTIQFQVRDPGAADDDLQVLLRRTKSELGDLQAVGALLCCCNGRGEGLFGAPDHDARLVEEVLGPLPIAGFFCNGEIGPVGGKNFLHGFTASIALIVPA